MLIITPTIEDDRIVLALSRCAGRLGFTLEEWRALRDAGDGLAEVIRERQEAKARIA